MFCSNAKWFPKDNLAVRVEHQTSKPTQGCSNAAGGACSEGWDGHLAVLLALKLLTVEPGQSLWTHEPEGLFIFLLKRVSKQRWSCQEQSLVRLSRWSFQWDLSSSCKAPRGCLQLLQLDFAAGRAQISPQHTHEDNVSVPRAREREKPLLARLTEPSIIIISKPSH